MAINGSELINNPFDTVFSPFSDILGGSFWLIPIGFIAVALYVKTRTPAASSVWLMSSCLILGSGTIFSSYPSMSFVYYLFAIIGLVGVIVSMLFMKK